MLRLGALALIVAAFARPFLRGTTLAASAGGARDVVILLDRSYSMGHGDQWDRAQRAAADAVNTLVPTAIARRWCSSATVGGGRRAADQRSRRGCSRRDQRGDAWSPARTRYGPAFKLAGSLLAESNLPRREVVLISDFQRSGWTAGDGLRFPIGTVVTPVVVEAERRAERRGDAGQRSQRETCLGSGARDRHRRCHQSQRRAGGECSRVARDRRTRRCRRCPSRCAPHGAATTTFAPVTITAANTRAAVRIGDDALGRDNAFHFVLSPPRPVDVALVSRAHRATSALYLTRALAIGEAPRFAVTTRAVDDLTDEVLSRTRVIILDDVSPSDAMAARLKRFVENGGGAARRLRPAGVVAGDRGGAPAGDRGRRRSIAAAAPRHVGGLEYGHAVFEPFRAPRSGDFSAARFYGYRSVTPDEGRAGAGALRRWRAGARRATARPRSRAACGPRRSICIWNDLALKPVFLPFVHQVVRHLSAIIASGRIGRRSGR